MGDVAILCQGIGKKYRIGERERYKALRDVVTEAIRAPFRRVSAAIRKAGNDANAEPTIWALKDVSFEVKRGEVLGIIGRNGAGKSTLLKILSRITEPTQGYGEIWGRVGSLLEVGTGFHPELTGRENIFLNGAILGMRKAEMERRFDEIVAFAELEKFIDTPVKRYSSGMYMRLAFSVAAHLEPEILLVDEVLAVGDAIFQKKCLTKMEKVGHEGRTVVFVSHNMTAIQRLCHRAVWIERGSVIRNGMPAHVVGEYLRTSVSSTTEQFWENIATAPGNEIVRIRRATVRLQHLQPLDGINVRTPFIMEFEYWNLKPDTFLNLSLHVLNEEGVCAFNTGPAYEQVWQGKAFPAGLFRSICYVPGDLLNDGLHRVQLLVVQNQGIIIYRHEDILTFDVQEAIESREGYLGEWPGVVRPRLEWQTELLESLTSDRQMELDV